ncbi:MAG: PKD domain-containing protein, partial [Bacteroidota bacterium]
HFPTTSPGTFNYFAVVTDQNGCQSTSNNIIVEQEFCTGGPGGCTPSVNFTHGFTFAQGGFCNEVDFNVTSTNVNSFVWDFDDPFGNGFTGPVTSPTHTYTEAGCYIVYLDGQVPAVGGGTCLVETFETVCVPVAANFDFSASCDEVSFTDLSTFLSSADIILNWNWNFGAGASPASHIGNTPPVVTYSTPGSKTVTLTVTSLNGCTAQISQNLVVPGLPNPPLSVSPGPYCVGDPVQFDASGPGLISWNWDFGNGINNGANDPTHTYLAAGPKNISVTITDDKGCENVLTTSINVSPAPTPGSISDTGLVLCEGQSTTLTAPPGASYLWSTGETTASILVSTAGSYNVVVTDANDCSYTTDPVEVIVNPLPIAQINGPNVICDNDCITLTATPGTGFIFKWFDGNGDDAGNTGSITLCGTGFISPYTLFVTDANGCEGVSDPFDIIHGISPTPNITAAPSPACEGQLTTLTVDPPLTAIYTWSTGDVGPSITVSQAGAYTVIATDPVSGCIGSDTEVVNPLPDLCLVPVGCYERCPGDTICGPEGLDFYQWNFNGNPMAGENGPCLVVNNTGVYNLTAMNEFGCTTTSGDLEITIIPCDDPCEMVDVIAAPFQIDSEECCWVIDLENGMLDTIIGIRIEAQGGLDLGYQGSPAGWSQIGASSSHVELIPTGVPYVPTGIGTGLLDDVAVFCLDGYTTSPQEVVVSWLFEDLSDPLGFSIPCTDTLEFECTPPIDSSGCLTIVNDSIYCEGDSIKYTFSLFNTALAGFSFESAAINIDTGVAVIVDPNPIVFPPIGPGQTGGPFTVCLSGADLIPGDSLKFTLTAHDTPITADDPPFFCCNDTIEYCLPIPICDPCEFVSATATKDTTDCCWFIDLDNQYDPNYFT